MKQKAYFIVLGLTLFGLLLVYAIYAFSKQQINLRNNVNVSYTVNSNTNQNAITPTPFSTGPAGFLLESPASIKVGQTFNLIVESRADIDPVNLLSVKLNFPKETLQIVKINTADSFVSLWAKKSFDNKLGTVTLIGGVPTPGFKTVSTDRAQTMAVIEMKAISLGTATINFDPTTQIFRNSDNANILNLTQPVAITVSK